MIDIHSHILYGVDDGAQEHSDSVDLARIYVEAGYQLVVATPHAEIDSLPSKDFAGNIRGLVVHLNQALRELGVELVLFPGMEVGLDPLLPEMVKRKEILTLADSHYLMVETSFTNLPLNWWEVVFELAARGVVAIFAHPERCVQVAEKPEILDQMNHAGVKFQVNWDSFTGAYGRQVAQVARYMARNGYIHCLATDSHNRNDRHPGSVREIESQLKDLIGEENLKRIAVENPARVVEDKPLLDMDQDKMPKSFRHMTTGWKRRFFRR